LSTVASALKIGFDEELLLSRKRNSKVIGLFCGSLILVEDTSVDFSGLLSGFGMIDKKNVGRADRVFPASVGASRTTIGGGLVRVAPPTPDDFGRPRPY
jgi:hypothetical protein